MNIETALVVAIVGLIGLLLTIAAMIYRRGERDRAAVATAEAAAAKATDALVLGDELEKRVRVLEQTTVKVPEFEKAIDKLEGRISQLITTSMTSFGGRLESVQQMLNAVLSQRPPS